MTTLTRCFSQWHVSFSAPPVDLQKKANRVPTRAVFSRRTYKTFSQRSVRFETFHFRVLITRDITSCPRSVESRCRILRNTGFFVGASLITYTWRFVFFSKNVRFPYTEADQWNLTVRSSKTQVKCFELMIFTGERNTCAYTRASVCVCVIDGLLQWNFWAANPSITLL